MKTDTMSDVICPSCNAADNVCIGKIQQMRVFAGNAIPMDLHRGTLYRCKVCNLFFKWPHLEKEVLDKLYTAGNPDHWQYKIENRTDWEIAANWIKENFSIGSVLDIGCWDGRFLETLKGRLDLNGIEINLTAAIQAMKRGVKLIGKNIDEMDKVRQRFDVVTAFDIIEHVKNPLQFIRLMSSVTKRDGKIIVSSGDAETFIWKITRGKNLYCANPEHFSFISEGFCTYAAKMLNLQIIRTERFIHSKRKFAVHKFLFDSLVNGIYLTVPSVLRNVRRLRHAYFDGNKKVLDRSFNYPPPWTWKTDHLLVIFGKRL